MKPHRGRKKTRPTKDQGARISPSPDTSTTRLNKYIAHAGVCSRREADELIRAGKIKVNGKTVTAMGYSVGPRDKVTFQNKILRREQPVYVLLNKPKDYITTTKDPDQRQTVMQLVSKACKERIFPVGRLDRNTTGLLLLTNDGDLAKKLTHPSHGVRKLYQVQLDRGLSKAHLAQLLQGVELHDGPVYLDGLEILSADRTQLGIEIHSGRNRVVRRLFEHLDYEVKKLDRAMFAGLTKKDLPRGKWRYLTHNEVIHLKHLDRGALKKSQNKNP